MNEFPPPEVMRSPEGKEKPPARIFFIRHSRATYSSYAEKLASDTPESALDIESQVPDLSPEGIEIAKAVAARFFSDFDPKEDIFFLAASTQMRALETAKIYANIAREKGFEVIAHDRKGVDDSRVGTQIEETVGEGSVRSLHALSLKMENQVLGNVFNPEKHSPSIHWEAVDPRTKELYEQARSIIQADDRGSWGANFHAHAEKVKEIIPEMETPMQLHETQFKNMQRLAEWARTKAPADKRLNVVGFGHENYMGHALEVNTGDPALGNVEAVELVEDGSVKRV